MTIDHTEQLSVLSHPPLATPYADLHAMTILVMRDLREEKNPRREDFENTLHMLQQNACFTIRPTYRTDRILAMSCLVMRPEPQLTSIEAVVTDRDHRGKGYGKLAVNAAEEYAADSGISRVILCPERPAMDFYTSLGYQILPGSRSSRGDPYWQKILS